VNMSCTKIQCGREGHQSGIQSHPSTTRQRREGCVNVSSTAVSTEKARVKQGEREGRKISREKGREEEGRREERWTGRQWRQNETRGHGPIIEFTHARHRRNTSPLTSLSLSHTTFIRSPTHTHIHSDPSSINSGTVFLHLNLLCALDLLPEGRGVGIQSSVTDKMYAVRGTLHIALLFSTLKHKCACRCSCSPPHRPSLRVVHPIIHLIIQAVILRNNACPLVT
jgi:hypothetical protein